jgi:hypothetical protein
MIVEGEWKKLSYTHLFKYLEDILLENYLFLLFPIFFYDNKIYYLSLSEWKRYTQRVVEWRRKFSIFLERKTTIKENIRSIHAEASVENEWNVLCMKKNINFIMQKRNSPFPLKNHLHPLLFSVRIATKKSLFCTQKEKSHSILK